MSRHFFSSTSVSTNLAALVTSGQTTITVPEIAGDNGWPTSFPFRVALDYGLGTFELVDVTSKGGLVSTTRTWNVTRGVDSTTGQGHASNATVRHVIAAGDMLEVRNDFQGNWNQGTVYYTDDVVESAGQSFVALTGNTGLVPSPGNGLNTALATLAATTLAGSLGGVSLGFIAQKFQPSANISVAGVQVSFSLQPFAGSFTYGLATAVGASPTYVAGAGPYSWNTYNGTPTGAVQLPFAGPVALTSGTVYYLVISGGASNIAVVEALAEAAPANITATGIANPVANTTSDMVYGASYGTTSTTLRLLFTALLAGTSPWALQGVGLSNAVPQVVGTAGVIGGAPTASRADHVHGPDPRGLVAYNLITSCAATSASTTNVVILTCTATLSASRCYRVWHSTIHTQSTAAADYTNVFIHQSAAGGAVGAGSTQIAQQIVSAPAAGTIRDGKGNEILLNAPAAGTYQFGVFFARIAAGGGGTVSIGAAAARPAILAIEDVGPAQAVTT